LLLELLELFLGGNTTAITALLHGDNHVFFVLDDLPEEAVSEVFFEASVQVGVIGQNLVLVPADERIFEE